MIPHRVLIDQVIAEPFVPFQIHTASGRSFPVPHPEFVQIGKSIVTVYAAPENDPDGPQRWEKLSMMLIESIAPLTAHKA